MKNEVKNAIRHLVTKAYEVFATNKSDVSVVSLPGTAWEFENNVINHKDFTDNFGTPYNLDITLCEYNTETFNSNLRPISTLIPHNKSSAYALSRKGVLYYNRYLNEDIIKKSKSNNIFAWFDFCGNPTTENINLINTAKDKVVTYIFTFNTHWRCDNNVDPAVYELAKKHNKAFSTYVRLCQLAYNNNLTIVWNFEYISNHNPMMTVCFSNDPSVLADQSFRINTISYGKKINLVKPEIKKNINTKKDFSAVYADVKAKISDKDICAIHNISNRTLAAVKAWITMGK